MAVLRTRTFTPWSARTDAKSSEQALFSCHLPDKDCRDLLDGAAMVCDVLVVVIQSTVSSFDRSQMV